VQTQFLQRYAPNSLHLLFHPVDTGNPNFDFNTHLEQFANRRLDIDYKGLRLRNLYSGNVTRIDLESTQLIGGRVLGRVEIDLGPVDEAQQQYKILAVPYAEKQLGNNDDAVEFVRVVKAAVSAGVEADPRSLQIWASWGYGEIKHRYTEVLRNNPSLANRALTSPTDANLLGEFRAIIIQDVLTEINAMAMELTAITTTNEDRLLEEPKTTEIYFREEQLTPRERQDLFELRCEELLFNHEAPGPFAAELKLICSKLSPANSSGFIYDDEMQFQSYLTDMSVSGGLHQEGLEALQESHERVTEQYSEGGVVSLHMSDGERFVVDGTLEDDVTSDYLPEEAKNIASDIHQLFTEGESLETIYTFITLNLNRIYGDPSDEAVQVIRTMRRVKTLPGQVISGSEYTYRDSIYPNVEERQYVREVLDILIETMQRDFILRSMNRSTAFRTFHNAIINAPNVHALIATIQETYQARLSNNINIKMFTALDTLYKARRAYLESTPVEVIEDIGGKIRRFIPAAPIIAMARTIPTRQLRKLATRIHSLPREERERVRRLLRDERPALYNRILNGLLEMVNMASHGKLGYLRFAFYQDRETGRPNEPHNMIHLLTSTDFTTVWEGLKTASGIPQPVAA
jgi:hypothetical protein